ncbi:MAG: long-chain-fatty-acid--CoA ligase [Mycobacteriaceae bacterium]|nr:long-chain-fatty-acid--CoA ligase [Mycobacteriaceae bacterium]
MYVTQALHQALQQEPDRIATIFRDRVRTVRESADRVARFAGALRSLGVAPGDLVAILALNSDRYHEYFYAVPWIGAAVHPVNIRLSVPEILDTLRRSDTRVLLVDDTFAPLVAELQFDGLRTVVHIGDGDPLGDALSYEELLSATDPVPDTRTGGDSVLAVLFTGGTTGVPRGVMLSHDNVVVSALGVLASGHVVSPHGRLLHAAPMFHVGGIAYWAAGNVHGAEHVIVPMFDPAAVLGAIARHAVTDALLVPTMIQRLVDSPELGDYDCGTLRHLVYGASPISESLLQRARAAFPSAGFTQVYGMTELAPTATLLSPSDHDEPELRRAAGRAAPHCEIRVVDPTGGAAPPGEIGEIVVRGGNVMLGYLHQRDETAKVVKDGWMHTGDAGYLDDRGYLFVVDRIKDMIITGGENVYSAEVENALAKHPAVAAAAAIGVPDPEWGERVHAVVVLKPDMSASADELRTHCAALIANYKVPGSFAFTDALPLSAAGKVLKRELREDYRSGSG